MAEDLTIVQGTKAEIYQSLIPQIKALLEGEPDLIANLASVSAALKEQFSWLWVDFIFGRVGVVVVTMMILLAMLGSINGSVMTWSRIGYAMAEQGHFPAGGGRLDERFGTPVFALWAQAGLTIALILSHGFTALMSYPSCAMLISGSLVVYSVVRLRRLQPERPRPYRLGWYPWAPLLYIFSSLCVLIVLVVERDLSVFMAAGWFAVALVGHHFLVRPRLR